MGGTLDGACHNALAFLESLSPADRSDIGIRPADFPRIAREMAGRRPC